MKKVAIITGSSSGFGLLTTIMLAREGFEVIATMRNIEKAEQFRAIVTEQEVLERIHVHCLDVTDPNSVEELKKRIESIDCIDVLINNAGFAIGGFAEEIDIDDYRRQFETNVFGVIAVTQAVLPKMRQQQQGKIINMSSVSGQIAFPGLSPYAASKHALEGYTESLRLEVKPYGIQVALVEPGSFKTNIWSSGMEVSRPTNSSYQSYLEAILHYIESGKAKHGDPNQVATLICTLAKAPKLRKLRYPIGRGLRMTIFLKQFLPWQLWERVVLKQILRKSRV